MMTTALYLDFFVFDCCGSAGLAHEVIDTTPVGRGRSLVQISPQSDFSVE